MSKKNIVKLIALIIVVAIAVLSLPACTFISENEERVSNEVLATVKHENGVTLEVSRNEIMDYFNSYAYYLMYYYQYSVQEALDYAIENKIKNKYLVAEAMPFLASGDATKVNPNRAKSILVGGGSYAKPEDVLTLAERYASIYSVNKSIDDQLESARKTSYQEYVVRVAEEIEATNVKEIIFADSTKAFLKDEYYVGDELDKTQIKIKVVYKDGTMSEEFIAPDTYYTTDFSSTTIEEGSQNTTEQTGTTVEKKFVLTFKENVQKDGEVTEELHTLEHKYTLVAPRATKTEEEPELADDKIEIGEVEVSRYATESEIVAAGAKQNIRDINAEYEALKSKVGSDEHMVEAYRITIENIDSANKNMTYFYKTAYESQVLAALQAELYQKCATVTDEQILAEFEYLYTTAKSEYKGDAEDVRKTFVEKIGTNLETLYYYPQVENLDDYYYVYQILFKYNAEQEKFFKDNSGSEDADVEALHNYLYNLVMTKESNPDYDAEYECEYHDNGKGTECSYEKDNAGKVCPSIAYIGTEKNASTVIADLEADLLAATTQEEKLAIFEDYMYRYNDDGGIMNNSLGYLIPANDKDSSFYEGFLNLAKDVVGTGNPTVGDAMNDSNKIAIGYTPYGIHLIMVSATPFADGTAPNFDFTTEQGKQDALDYLKRTIDNKGTTLYEKLKKSLIAERESVAYSDFALVVPTDIYDTDPENYKVTLVDDVKDIITIKAKKLKKIYKEYANS